MTTLRGESKPLPTRKVTHVRAPNGRVFVATPQLLEKPGMTPIYEDGREATTMHETVDVAKLIEDKGRPSHVRLPNGRVLVASDALLERGDFEMLWNHKPEPVVVNAPHPLTEEPEVPDVSVSHEVTEEDIVAEEVDEKEPFNLSRATKQAIQDEAMERFGVEISMDQTAVQMRAEFEELRDAANEDDDTTEVTAAGTDGADLDENNQDNDQPQQVAHATGG